MPLYWFLLVISALASDSVPVREVPALQALSAAVGLMCGWGLLVRIATRTAIQQVLSGSVSFIAAANAFERQMEYFRWFALLMSQMALVGFGVAGLLERLPWGSESMFLRGVLLLIPSLSATFWTWWCELRFDNATHPAHAQRWWHYALTMFRMQGAWLVAPVLMLLMAIDAAQFMFGLDRAYGAYVGGGLALLALPVSLPWIMSRIWKLKPLEDAEQHDWCEQLMSSTRTRGTRLLQWDTNYGMCTAMIAGFVPGFRRLLLSDALLLRLSAPQLAMVIFHELAHLHRFHLPMRLASLVPVWCVAAAATALLGDMPYADVIGIGVGLIASLVALRWIAYRTEFDADQHAVRLAVRLNGQVPGVPITAEVAGSVLANALLAVTMDHPSSRRATWMHPSIDERVRRLKACGKDAQVEAIVETCVDTSRIGDATRSFSRSNHEYC